MTSQDAGKMIKEELERHTDLFVLVTEDHHEQVFSITMEHVHPSGETTCFPWKLTMGAAMHDVFRKTPDSVEGMAREMSEPGNYGLILGILMLANIGAERPIPYKEEWEMSPRGSDLLRSMVPREYLKEEKG